MSVGAIAPARRQRFFIDANELRQAVQVGQGVCPVLHVQLPKAEVVSILGTLLSFPNHFLEVPVFQSSLLTTALIEADDLKDRIIDLLLKAGKREPAGLARSVDGRRCLVRARLTVSPQSLTQILIFKLVKQENCCC